MNAERAIEDILEIQARAEPRMDRTDRQIQATQKLIRTGMRILVQIENGQKRTDAKPAELAESHKRMDQKLVELADAQLKTDGNSIG